MTSATSLGPECPWCAANLLIDIDPQLVADVLLDMIIKASPVSPSSVVALVSALPAMACKWLRPLPGLCIFVSSAFGGLHFLPQGKIARGPMACL